MSISGPYSQATDFSHAYNIPDIRGPLPRGAPCPGTLWDLICRVPDFSRFKWIVERAQMSQIFNNQVADYTVFIPNNSALSSPAMEAVLVNMGILEARAVVRTMTVSRRLSSEVLRDDPIYYLYPIDSNNRLCITNLDEETRIDSNVRVIVFDLVATNGIAHVVDGLVRPIVSGGGT